MSIDDANGNIIKYAVCYQLHSSNVDYCATNTTVKNGTKTSFTLIRLNEGTTYYIAIKASTAVGFGGIGFIVNVTTPDDSK